MIIASDAGARIAGIIREELGKEVGPVLCIGTERVCPDQFDH